MSYVVYSEKAEELFMDLCERFPGNENYDGFYQAVWDDLDPIVIEPTTNAVSVLMTLFGAEERDHVEYWTYVWDGNQYIFFTLLEAELIETLEALQAEYEDYEKDNEEDQIQAVSNSAE